MMRTPILTLAIVLPAMLAGCATPATQISNGLQDYGLAPANAQCIGTRLQSNLSLGQLQRLGAAAKAFRNGDTTPGRVTPSDLVRVAGELRDPEIALEVGKAAAGCGLNRAM